MTPRRPILLRWAEESEAEQVRALAVLEHKPDSGAARPVESIPLNHSVNLRSTLLPRFISWFSSSATQITSDGER